MLASAEYLCKLVDGGDYSLLFSMFLELDVAYLFGIRRENVYAHIHMYIQMHVYVYTCMCVHVYMYTPIFIFSM